VRKVAEKLKYACIGAGGIADKKHLNEYSKRDSVEVAAICDSNIAAAERLAQKYNVKNIFTDYNEMFDKLKLDFISVCTPNYLHAPITISALKKGISVHCEKPLAINAEEAQEIVDAKNKYKGKVMVALNNRFTAESAFVKSCVEKGMFGEIYHAKCGWRRRNGIPGKGVWFTDKKLSGGGALIDLGVHYLDLVMYFMGYPKVVSVSGATYSKFANSDNRLRAGYKNNGDGKFDVEDMAIGHLRTDSNATINFEFSWASNIEKEVKYYELMGTKGGVSFVNGELKLYSEIFDTSINILPDVSSNRKVVSEFDHFIDCIINDKEPDSKPEQGAALMKIIDAAYKSSELMREISL